MRPLAPGTLLVAEPPMGDPNFKRTVVLLCEHTPAGSFGLILNRESPLQLAEVAGMGLPEHLPLGVGGPVQPDTLHFLHPCGEEVETAIRVAEGIYWGGDFGTLLRGIDEGRIPAADIRFFLGYSGWGAGQLEAEVEEGGWILLRATPKIVFSDTTDELWRRILRKLGGDYALLSTYPDNPRFN